MTSKEPSRFLLDREGAVAVEVRRVPGDFRVEEEPRRSPAGHGAHLHLRVEASGWSTPRLVDEIGRRLGIRRRALGVPGLKDARAVTVQWLSVPGRPRLDREEVRVRLASLRGVRVLEVARDPAPLATGELRENRFDLRLRPESGGTSGAGPEDWLPRAFRRTRYVLDTLSRAGVPNWFGPQRFGVRGDSDALGRALLHRRHEEALSWLLGRPGPVDTPRIRAARAAWEEGDLEAAFRGWPPTFREQREALHRLRRGGTAEEAVRSLPRGLRRFLTHAVQSRIFNHVLAARLSRHGELLPGDLSLDGNGILRRVGSGHAGPAPPGELVATGPLPGRRCGQPGGVPGRLERRVFHRAGIGPRGELLNRGPGSLGERRALAVVPTGVAVDPGEDEFGPHVRLRFTLPPGSYATALLREVDGRPDGIPGPLRPRLPGRPGGR